jgi:hypothetical protein
MKRTVNLGSSGCALSAPPAVRPAARAFVWQVETRRSLDGRPISLVRARIRLLDGRLSRMQTISRTDQVT